MHSQCWHDNEAIYNVTHRKRHESCSKYTAYFAVKGFVKFHHFNPMFLIVRTFFKTKNRLLKSLHRILTEKDGSLFIWLIAIIKILHILYKNVKELDIDSFIHRKYQLLLIAAIWIYLNLCKIIFLIWWNTLHSVPMTGRARFVPIWFLCVWKYCSRLPKLYFFDVESFAKHISTDLGDWLFAPFHWASISGIMNTCG